MKIGGRKHDGGSLSGAFLIASLLIAWTSLTKTYVISADRRRFSKRVCIRCRTGRSLLLRDSGGGQQAREKSAHRACATPRSPFRCRSPQAARAALSRRLLSRSAQQGGYPDWGGQAQSGARR